MFRPCSLFSLSSLFSGKRRSKTPSSFFLFAATVSCIADRVFTVCTTREAPCSSSVANSQSLSSQTSQQHLLWLITPSSSAHFLLHWLLAHPALLVFLLVTVAPSQVLAGFSLLALLLCWRTPGLSACSSSLTMLTPCVISSNILALSSCVHSWFLTSCLHQTSLQESRLT